MAEACVRLGSVVRRPDRQWLLAMVALLALAAAGPQTSANTGPSVGVRVSDGRAPSVYAEFGSRAITVGLSAGARSFSVPSEGSLFIGWLAAYVRGFLEVGFLEGFATIGPTLQVYRVANEEQSGIEYLVGGDLRVGVSALVGGDRMPIALNVAALVSATTAGYTYVGVGSPVLTWEVGLSWQFP